jgi:hypothetical protein
MRSSDIATVRLRRGFANAAHAEREQTGVEERFLLVELVLVDFPDLDDLADDLHVEANCSYAILSLDVGSGSTGQIMTAMTDESCALAGLSCGVFGCLLDGHLGGRNLALGRN